MKTVKSNLSFEDVKHIAKLAHLKLTDQEMTKFQKQLASILDFVSALSAVDTKDVIPTSQVTGLENVFREDEVKKSLSQSEALVNAKRKHNGYFAVDAIFE